MWHEEMHPGGHHREGGCQWVAVTAHHLLLTVRINLCSAMGPVMGPHGLLLGWWLRLLPCIGRCCCITRMGLEMQVEQLALIIQPDTQTSGSLSTSLPPTASPSLISCRWLCTQGLRVETTTAIWLWTSRLLPRHSWPTMMLPLG
jgi:hypothetical protein